LNQHASLMLTEKQRGVLVGMMTGLAVTLLALGLAIAAPPRALLPEHDVSSAIVQALRWDILLVVWLAANIATLARHRFFTPADIDGGGLSEGTSPAKLLQSILQNTLEQSVLAFSAHVIWAAAMPLTWQAAVPAAAILFFLGRMLFWRGYSHGAPARALGFALTFYPSLLMLVLVVGRLACGLITS
jgi:hypothetical protein